MARAGSPFGDSRGVALVEFALLLPLLFTIYFGTVALSEAVIAKRKLNLAVMTIGDLASQAPQVQQVQTIGSADARAIFGAGAAIMGPEGAATLRMRLTSIVIDAASGVGCVDWSIGSNMAGLSAGSSFPVPNDLKLAAATSRRSFIVAEGKMDFTPPTQGIVPGSMTFAEGPGYIVPRATDRVLVDTTVQTPAVKCS